MNYSVHETFLTAQGEGAHTGRAAYFIRLMGCDVGCAFCDAAATWHKDFKPKDVERLSARQIATRAWHASAPGTIAVITGGEPCLWDLTELVDELHDAGFQVHLETAGHHVLPSNVDWVTISPKAAKPPKIRNLRIAHEFKIIVENEQTLARDLELILPYSQFKPVWLHPEWSQHENKELLSLMVDTVKLDPRLRLGWQTHKNYLSDARDPGSRPPVPLGGGQLASI